MTLFGWDASHFDGPLSRPILDRARAEGIDFFTHKIGEGLADTEGTLDDTALAAARDAGVPFIGGYLIPRSNATPAAQVARWLQLAETGEPWWRSFPGWFWQVDLERWSYDNVAASQGITCAQLLRAATGRCVVLYASRGQYGDSLTGWDGPLWNADYRAGPGYPGDGWVAADKGAAAGWAPYSGKAPAILQYTSSATIAGLSTCDKNAYRGSLDDFRTMIGGKTAMGILDSDAVAHDLVFGVKDMLDGTNPTERGDKAPNMLHGRLAAILSQAQSNGSTGSSILSKLDGLGAPASVDPAAFAAALTSAQLAEIGTAMGAELARRLAD